MATIEFEKITEGEAYKFRKTINDNFSQISEVIEDLSGQIEDTEEKIKENAIDIEVSIETPDSQKVGDFWFKVVE